MYNKEEYTSDPRRIDVDEARTLEELNDFLITLRTRINYGEGLMGLGAAIVAIDELLEEGGVPEDNWPIGLISVSVGLDQGNRDFNEGQHYSIEITSEGICLDYLYRCYTSEYGSDHSSETMTELSPTTHFDDFAVNQWLRKAKELLNFDSARVNASLDIW